MGDKSKTTLPARKRAQPERELDKRTRSNLKSLRDSRIVKQLDSAVFVELPAFERHRQDYLEDAAYSVLQGELLANPEAGELIRDTGGLRKVRVPDEGRGKGKRGGIRVIYYWSESLTQFWLFTLYGKDEADDLTPEQRKRLKGRLENELNERASGASPKGTT